MHLKKLFYVCKPILRLCMKFFYTFEARLFLKTFKIHCWVSGHVKASPAAPAFNCKRSYQFLPNFKAQTTFEVFEGARN